VATLEIAFLNNQLEERKRRLEQAMASSSQQAGLAGLLREVDSALARMATQLPSTAARIVDPASVTALSASSSTPVNVKNAWICEP